MMKINIEPPSRSRHTFLLLDGFRGLAAVCVMFYHYTPFLSNETVLGSSYLAVDLFFVLSGFVVAYAYEHKLRTGLGLLRFLLIRLIRLYPIYIAGSAAGLFFVLVRNALDPAKYTAPLYLLEAIGRTALFIPDFRDRDTLTGLFPFDQAAWSLSLEMAVNILYAALFRWLTTWMVAAIAIISAAALVVTVYSYGTIDLGSTAPSLWAGVLRCLFGFFAGVLLFRLGQGRFVLSQHAPLAIVVLVFVMFAINTHGAVRIVHDLACALVVIPLLVWIGGREVPMPRAGSFVAWTAALSYPIYIFHTPVAWTLEWLTSHALGRPGHLMQPYAGIGFGLAIIVLSQLMVTFFDIPLRRRLTALSRRQVVAPA